MISLSRRRLLGALFVTLIAAAPALANQNRTMRFAWWKAESVVAELNLAADQVSRIDQIFQTMRGEARQELEELERLEGKLSRLIETDADEAQVVRAIDRVETARATLSKTRSLMLLRMRQVLTPDQRTKLTAMQKRWESCGKPCQDELRQRRPESGRQPDSSPEPRRD